MDLLIESCILSNIKLSRSSSPKESSLFSSVISFVVKVIKFYS